MRGATYADARVMDIRHRDLSTKNGQVGTLAESESLGIGIRVIAQGSWGFASTDRLTREGIAACAAEAVAIAKASALAKRHDVEMVPVEAYQDTWQNPYVKDPFRIPLERQLDLLLAADKRNVARQGRDAHGNVHGVSPHRAVVCVVDRLGDPSGQDAVRRGNCRHRVCREAKFRSAPIRTVSADSTSLRATSWWNRSIWWATRRASPRKPSRCIRRAQSPEGTKTIILDSSQLGLQIHESIGHPIELDRVLGMEANFAGMSFLTLEKLGKLRYGSDIVNVVADARLEHGPGLGTFGYDDEGVPAQCTPIITDGLFTGYLSNRETAVTIGLKRSGGTMRTESWNRLPIIRMTNISILPGTWRYEDLIADTDDAILMETNRSWSIDDRRYHFQFSTEIGWEIKGGKKTRMLKNPSYSGITTEFWNSCDAICSREHWTLWGTPNCGKGQPMQTMGTGHGASPARFRNVKLGAAFAKS